MPGDPYIASWATQLAGARGDQTDAIVRWQALAEAFPDLPHPHNSMAYAQHARGDEQVDIPQHRLLVVGDREVVDLDRRNGGVGRPRRVHCPAPASAESASTITFTLCRTIPG